MTYVDDGAAITLLNVALRTARPGDERITSDRDSAERLAKACGGLPLALQISVALLAADPALSASELADELAAEHTRRMSLPRGNSNQPRAPAATAAFELSYRRQAEPSKRAFRLLPVHPGPDMSTATAAVLADLPLGEMLHVLTGLADAHLIETVPLGGRWRMHELVRLYAEQISHPCSEADERDQARDRLLDYYLSMAEAADSYLRALPGTAVPDEFMSRDAALAWLDAERPSLIGAAQMAADTGRDEAALCLPLLLAQYFAWRRQFDDLVATTIISLSAARRLGDHYREGDALTNLGGALLEVRRFGEAITAHQDAAAIFRETGDRPSEADALNNLGLALKGMLRFEEAITAHQNAAAIYQETGNRHGQGNALNNLGLALRGMRRLDEAITTCQDAAAIYQETGDPHGQAIALNNFGIALREVGRFEEAASAHQEAATKFREVGDEYREGIALENLERLRSLG